MGTSRSDRAERATGLARGAADWLLNSATDCEDVSLYHGLTGILLGLHEAAEHFGDERYRNAPAGPWATQASSVNSFDMYGSPRAGSRATQSRGPTISSPMRHPALPPFGPNRERTSAALSALHQPGNRVAVIIRPEPPPAATQFSL